MYLQTAKFVEYIRCNFVFECFHVYEKRFHASKNLDFFRREIEGILGVDIDFLEFVLEVHE